MNRLLFLVVAGCWTAAPPPPPPPPPIATKPPVIEPAPVPTGVEIVVGKVPKAANSAIGAITGTVRDGRGEPLAGVTVVATSAVLTGAQAVITDENGGFVYDQMPPGPYTVTFYYGEVTLAREIVVTDQHATTIKVERWKIPSMSP